MMAKPTTQEVSWKHHWRAKPDEGKMLYFKRGWYIGWNIIGMGSLLYYLKQYRSDLPMKQSEYMSVACLGYCLRELLSWTYIHKDDRPIKNEELWQIVFGTGLCYILPCYLAISNINRSEKYNYAINIASLVLSTVGHMFNSLAELQRKWWLAKPENKGKVYTKGFFSISRYDCFVMNIM